MDKFSIAIICFLVGFQTSDAISGIDDPNPQVPESRILPQYKEIRELPVGSVVWAAPYIFRLDTNKRLWVSYFTESQHFSKDRVEGRSIRLTRKKDGFVVECYDPDYKWRMEKLSFPKTWIPVINFMEREDE